MKRLLVATLVASVLVIGGGFATAQAQTTTTACGGSGLPACKGFDVTQDLGNKRQGDSFTVTIPPAPNTFRPGTPVAVTFNGQSVGTFTADASGHISLNIVVTEDGVLASQALGRQLFAAIGLNHLFFAETAGVTAVTINGTRYTAAALGVKNTLIGQGTASDSAAGKATTYFTIIGPTNTGPNNLSRTGAMILRWSLLGAALIATGVLVLLATRRRRATA